MTPENATQIQGIVSCMLKASTMRMMPDTSSEKPSRSVNTAAARQRVLEGEKSGDDVKGAKQQPEQKLTGLDLERVDHLGDAGDHHHDADHEHGGGGGHDHTAERDDAGNHKDDAERDDPTRLGAQRLERRVVRRVRRPG